MSRLFLLLATLLLTGTASLAQPGWQRVATLGGDDLSIGNFDWANGLAAAVPGPHHTLYVAQMPPSRLTTGFTPLHAFNG